MGFHRTSCYGLLVSFFIARMSYRYFLLFSAWLTGSRAWKMLYLTTTFPLHPIPKGQQNILFHAPFPSVPCCCPAYPTTWWLPWNLPLSLCFPWYAGLQGHELHRGAYPRQSLLLNFAPWTPGVQRIWAFAVDTLGEKMSRLICNEVMTGGGNSGIMDLPQMSQPPERNSTWIVWGGIRKRTGRIRKGRRIRVHGNMQTGAPECFFFLVNE